MTSTFIIRAASTPAAPFKHSNAARVTSLEHFGERGENEEMYADLVAALKAFGLKGTDLKTRKVYAYDSDAEAGKFKQASKASGVGNGEWPDAADLLKAGFKRVKGRSTSTVFLKGDTVLLLDEDNEEAPPMYVMLAPE